MPVPVNARFAEPLAPLVERVFMPHDVGYAAACRGFNLALTKQPALVKMASSTEDVVDAVKYAADIGLNVSVQATGHGGGAPVSDGLLVNTSGMRSIAIDPVARTARVGAGVRWRAVIEAAAPYGLAPLNGSSPDVGVVGLTLGGGMGPMGRTFGFSADHVRRLQLVTADGAVVEVDAARQPELF